MTGLSLLVVIAIWVVLAVLFAVGFSAIARRRPSWWEVDE